jgi:hypothetical protein
MKIILTGATGLIGGGILTDLLANPAITSVVTMTRRPLPLTHPKLTQITHTDFAAYDPSLLSSLSDASACIFALGLAMPKTPADGLLINQTYPLETAKALFSHIFSDKHKPFRFVYISGALVEKDQSKSLWLLPEARKMRGRTETGLLALSDEERGREVYICRPGFVGKKGGSVKDTVISCVMPVVEVDVLARAVVHVAVSGKEGEGSGCVEMEELVRLGKETK